MKQTILVKALIKHDDRLLLLRRSDANAAYQGLFELPGGKVDFGEDPVDALRRELLEEIGVELVVAQLQDTLSVVKDDAQDEQYVVLVYQVGLPHHVKIILSPEHNRYDWKKLSEIQYNELTYITKLIINTSPTDTTENSNSVQHIQKNDDKNTSNPTQTIIYCDGGSRGNPGPSASGYVIKDSDEQVLFEGGAYIGITTNNQAEYQAVKLALEKALTMDLQDLTFRLDSLLVVNQLNGLYQIKNRDLWPIHAAIKELVARFKKVVFTHVHREFNTEADAMVNKILDQHI